MKRLQTALFLSATATASLLAAPIANAFGVGLQPATVEMTVKPGERKRQTITIGNVHKERTISLSMSLADWSLDENGELVLDAPGDTERSAADWVRFSPAQVTLKPETSTDVVVEIATPFRVEDSGDHRFALLATTRLPNERGGVSGVWSKYQLASLFYLTFTPSESTPEVASVQIIPDQSGMLRMDVVNEGDAHARLQGYARVKDASGEVRSELEVNTVVLDRSKRSIELNIGKSELPSGTYSVEFDLDNAYAPQNGFRPMEVAVDTIEYVRP